MMGRGVAKIWVVKNKKRPEFYSRTSLCGFGRSGFAIFMLFLLIFAGVSVSAGTTKKGNGAGFEISVVKDYPGKVITLEVNGPPETEFQIILKDSDNRLISPKENVSFMTDEKGKDKNDVKKGRQLGTKHRKFSHLFPVRKQDT